VTLDPSPSSLFSSFELITNNLLKKLSFQNTSQPGIGFARGGIESLEAGPWITGWTDSPQPARARGELRTWQKRQTRVRVIWSVGQSGRLASQEHHRVSLALGIH